MGIENVSILDISGKLKDFTFVLTTKDYRHLGILHNIDYDSINSHGSLSSFNEISIVVYKSKLIEMLDGVIEYEEELWDKITDDKTLYIPELNSYYVISVQLDDSSDNIKKTITATSLCEAELGQVKIYGLEVNTEIDISRDDYVPTIFYDEHSPNSSLLDRVFSFMPQYRIMHVDESLCNIQRTFSVDEQAIYDWLTGECAEEFHCLFLFDSSNRGVYVYDLYSVCGNCGHREEVMDICPKCESVNIKHFGKDTGIYIDKENLTNSVQLTFDAGSVKNCFKLVAGDDLVTATVRLLNPNGSDFIYMPTDSQLKEMPSELREKIISYNKLYSSLEDDFEKLVTDLFNAMGQVDYYTHVMMPTIEHSEVTAQTEADKLTAINLSPLGLVNVTPNSESTVESALKNYAKIYIKSGYVKLEINEGKYTYIGEGSDGFIHGTWTGNFKVTNYSDSEDVAFSEIITVDVTNNYQTFLEQKVMKNIASNSDEEDSVFDVLNIDELDDFRSALELYCLNRLKAFYDAIQSALDVLIEVDQASEGADLYETFYLDYYNKLEACQQELDKRQETVDFWQAEYNKISEEQQKLQKRLNFRTCLGEELYSIFCLYRREETYRNDNYISDGLDNSALIKKAKEFLDTAKKELERARMPKITITSTLYNLLLMPEFKPIIKNFKLGNWLRIRVDDELYRLMLIGYDLSSSSIDTMSVEFANVTKVDDISDVTADILNKAQSMSTTYNYIANQASQGSDANDFVSEAVKNGLNSSLSIIKNNNNEEVIIDKHGFWAKTKDDLTGLYEPKQLRITHNILCYTKDDWKSVSLALGEHQYVYYDETSKSFKTDVDYGITANFGTYMHLYSSSFIGGKIYSTNYEPKTKGTYLDLIGGDFQLAGGKFLFDSSANKLSIKDVVIDWNTTTNPGVGHVIGLTDQLNGLSSRITINADSISSEVTRATKAEGTLSSRITQNADNIELKVSKDSIVSSINVSPEKIVIKSNKISLEGIVTANNYFKILTDGSMEATNATISGKITATTGQVANFTIENGYLYNGLGIGVKKSCGISCGTSRAGSDDYIFWAGNGAFRVDINGGLYASNLNVTGGSINVGNFSMNSNGDVVASNIKATGGYIGGASLDTLGVHFYNGSTGWGLWGTTAHANIAFHAGANGSNIGGAPFRVYHDGAVVCSNLTINGGSISVGNFSMDSSGNVTANALNANNANINGVLKSGTGSSIGIFKVDSNSIYSGSWDGNGADVFMSTGTSGAYTIASWSRSDWAFGAGGNFGVTTSGTLYCNTSYLKNLVVDEEVYMDKTYVSLVSSDTSATWSNIVKAANRVASGTTEWDSFVFKSKQHYYRAYITNGIITKIVKEHDGATEWA